MINLQGSELRFSSGDKSDDIICNNVQSISLNYSNQRLQTTYLGNYNSESKKPIINYTPIQLGFSYLKSDNNEIEKNLGLFNASGCCINLVDSNNPDCYGTRNYKSLYRPANSKNYAGQINLYSGAINQYTLNATIGSPISCSVSTEFLDMESVNNNSTQVSIPDNLILGGENISITGINFSGFGISGLQIQNISLNIGIQRTSSFKIGLKFPERVITDTSSQLQINGFLNNISELSKLSTINQENPENDIYLKIKNSCSDSDILNILIRKPTLDSQKISNQVGNLANVSLDFSVRPTIKPSEISGSNIIFS